MSKTLRIEELFDMLYNSDAIKAFKSWKEDYTFNTPTKEGVMSEDLQKEMLKVLQEAYPGVKIEVWDEKNSVRFKIRREFNYDLFQDVRVLSSVKMNLRRIRKIINEANKKFKRCKVFYLDYANAQELDSFNIVFNPAWRRYESYEILFRSDTQLRRKRGV